MEECKFIAQDTVRGYLLTMNCGFPALVLEEQAPLVHGEIYQIDVAKRGELDAIEGVPGLYHRLAVRTFNNMVCWVYVYPIPNIRPDVFKVLPGGCWDGKEGVQTFGRYLIESPEYNYPHVPKQEYDQASNMYIINQRYDVKAVQARMALKFAPAIDTKPLLKALPAPQPAAPAPTPVHPPHGADDAPFPGAAVAWAEKPERIILDNKPEVDSGI